MRPADNIEKLISKIEVEPRAGISERNLDDALAAQKKATGSAYSKPTVWRIIMKSKTTRLTTAAAIIFIAVVSIFFLDKSSTTAYGVADLPGLFEQAKVIHIRGTQYFGSHRMPDGSKILPVPVDNWIDFENGRSRYTGTGLSINKDDVKVTISEVISDGQYQMRLNHTERNVTFFKISDYQRILNTHKISEMLHGQMFGDIEQLQNFEKTTVEKINDVTYDIWQGELTSGIAEHSKWLKFWISPNTGELGRVQMFSKGKDGQLDLDYDLSDIEYNPVIPDDVFTMEIPEGYTLNNTKETAIPIELGGGGGVAYGDAQYSLRANILLGFIMPNDSIIAGWYSVDSNSEIPQHNIFTDLEFGGALPELPVEIYGLKPAVRNSDITYTGYHLTYTRKEDRFIEWSLYVPDGTPPVNIDKFGCHALYRFNLDPELKWRLGLNVDCSLLIENADDFDKWVLGAMAELSDDGMAPEHVTYQNVMELVRQIRESLNQ
jgi:outer membrane lipoprotein-sorting protein